MRYALLLLCCFALVGCATPPTVPADPQGLFDDQGFAARPVQDPRGIFSASEEMKRFLAAHFGQKPGSHARARRLLGLLNREGDLALRYDADMTRTAAEAFADRAGNCLSLLVMTASMAHELELGVRYYRVLVPDVWLREGDLLLASQHVNLSLEPLAVQRRPGDEDFSLTVDFMPPEEGQGLLRSEIGEQTVVAMFLNNRAAEHLVAGRLDDAYWAVRAAVLADPGYLLAYNTLGVVYVRAGKLALAERVFEQGLRIEPENAQMMANQEHLYRRLGQVAAADRLAERLRGLEPVPPYHYFLAALDALRRNDYPAARSLLERERKREPYNHEVLFALAMVWANLGDMTEARRYLGLARDNSTTLRSRTLYQAKLDRLRAS